MSFKYPIKKHAKKRDDGADVSKWNFEIKPFVVRWVVQMKENTCELGAIEKHMPLWNVARKERWCCRLMPRAQKGKEDDQQYI
jgi:hypothetical protein